MSARTDTGEVSSIFACMWSMLTGRCGFRQEISFVTRLVTVALASMLSVHACGENNVSAQQSVEAKIEALGLYLPEPIKPPPGVVLPFQFVRVSGDRAYVSGHGPQQADGSLAGPFGKVGTDVSEEEAYQVARLVTLAMIASLKRELGDLDRIKAWLRVFGMVNAAPSFVRTPLVINGCSDLLFELFGPERGQHARSAVGMASLPFDLAVEIEAEVLIDA